MGPGTRSRNPPKLTSQDDSKMGCHKTGVEIVLRSMHTVQAPQIDEHGRSENLIMDAIADGTVLVGSMATLARGLGVKVTDLRSTLRELLGARKIAVTTEMHGQLTVRLERRRAEPLPNLPRATERRRPGADAWIV
jgi:hypothetical protein